MIPLAHAEEIALYNASSEPTAYIDAKTMVVNFQDRSAIISSPPSSSERSGEGEGGDEMR